MIEKDLNPLEAEVAVLGLVLSVPGAIVEISDTLAPDDFSRPILGMIFQTALKLMLAGQPIDSVTVAARLPNSENISKILLDAKSKVDPKDANLAIYAQIVLETAGRRRASSLFTDSDKLINDKTVSYDDVLSQLQADVLRLTRENKQSEKIGPIMNRAIERVEKAVRGEREIDGIDTGYASFEFIWKRGVLSTIGARPGMGKTSFIVGQALHAAQDLRIPTLFFSMEMGTDELAHDRFLGYVTGIDSKRIEHGNISPSEFKVIKAAAKSIGTSPLYIEPASGLTESQIFSKILQFKQTESLGFVVIDYIQLIKSSRRGREVNRNEEISEVMRVLQQAAKTVGVPFLLASQLNRELEKRNDKHPILSDFRDSGSIEQESHLVLGIYRDDYYNPASSSTPGIGEFEVLKNRNGRGGYRVPLKWHPEIAKYEDNLRDYIKTSYPDWNK